MKISAKNQLGLAFDHFMKDDLFNLHYKTHLENASIQDRFDAMASVRDLFSDAKNKNFLFRQTALEISSRIKLDKGKLEDFSFLNRMPVKKRTFLVGDNKFYRWHRWSPDSDILVICVKLTDKIMDFETSELFKLPDHEIMEIVRQKFQEGKMSAYDRDMMLNSVSNQDFRRMASHTQEYQMWGINMQTGRLNYPENEITDDFFEEMATFMRLLIFTELSELEEVELKPNQTHGTKKEGKFVNESKLPVTIVDSSWNKIFVKGKFNVLPHLRWQRYGPGNSLAKIITIEEFEKEGYTRKVKKD